MKLLFFAEYAGLISNSSPCFGVSTCLAAEAALSEFEDAVGIGTSSVFGFSFALFGAEVTHFYAEHAGSVFSDALCAEEAARLAEEADCFCAEAARGESEDARYSEKVALSIAKDAFSI